MSVNSMSGKKRKVDVDYPFSDESASASYNPIDRSDYVSREAVGVPVPPVQPRGLVRESGRQFYPLTKMQKLHRDTEDIHNSLPSIKSNVDGIVDEAMRRMVEIHNRQDGSLLDPGQLSQEADQSIADLQEIYLTLVSAQDRIRQLNEYIQRAQENIHRKLSETNSVNYLLQQRSLQSVLDQLSSGKMTFEHLRPDQQFMVMSSTPPLQLQHLIKRGLIPEDMDTASSSGRGGKTKRIRKRQTKTRKNNKNKNRR